MNAPPPFNPSLPFQAEGGGVSGPPPFDPTKPFAPEGSTTGAPASIDDSVKMASNSPRWDVLGDTGRVASQSWDAGVDAASKAFQGPMRREERAQQNVAKYGPIVGLVKDMLVDTPKQFGHALQVPLSAMGVVASPITGLAHATLGSALSYIPGMADNQVMTPAQQDAIQNNPVARAIGAIGMRVPGVPSGNSAKQEADSVVDRSLAFAAPSSMRTGFNSPGQLAQEIGGAPQAAQADTIAANAQAAAQNPILAQARNAGYVIHPAESGIDSTIGNVAAQFGGKIKTQQAASVRNQEITNQIAAQTLGLPADATLDEATFNRVRAREGQAYRVIQDSAHIIPGGRVIADQQFLNDIAGLDAASADFAADFPDAAARRSQGVARIQNDVMRPDFSPRAGVEMIRNLRDDARANLRNWDDADRMRIGAAQRDAAQAIEDLIERRLTDAGAMNAVNNYRAARQTIAQSHDIEAATTPAGDVDARRLALLGQRRPLTGGLRVIADTAESFPKSMQLPSKFGGLERRSILDTLWSSGTGAAGIATGHALTGLGAAAIPLVRPLARDLALSNRVQNNLLGLRQIPGNVGPMLNASALPALGGQYAFGNLLSPRVPDPQYGQ